MTRRLGGYVARMLPLALLAFAPSRAAAQAPVERPAPTIVLRRGLVITRSATIARRRYRLSAPTSLDSALIVIKGHDITLDLNGAALLGAEPGADPDRAAGVAIRVDGGSHITIKGGTIHGYRVNILVRDTKDLTIESVDAGYSWKPRRYSLWEHESIADWLSFHHNEQNEWLRYGAGIYLDGVSGGEIRGVAAEQGMNGLMLARCDHLLIHDNTIQFNSGVGIGLYRSSDNRILHNRLDYNVRGYRHGFYSRGQDSADLLLFEQSSHNVVAYNSATHGGDGLFLWAGQSTMDSGEGGANDNLFIGNDFSFAPANAMEATFSRNAFEGNLAEGSDYGMWGGYSYESRMQLNCFVRDRVGIAIEHGQKNFISRNRFEGNGIAIRLWGDKLEPSDWGYPKHREIQSRGARILRNYFSRDRVGVYAADTRDMEVLSNAFAAVDTAIALKDSLSIHASGNTVTAVSSRDPAEACVDMSPDPSFPPDWLPFGMGTHVPSSPLSRRDRSAIVVDEWGPFDWRSPKLWPIDSARAAPVRLAVIGPEGRWAAVSRRGIAGVSATSGPMNDTITVTPSPDSAGDWALTLTYDGPAAQVPVPFSFGVFEPAQDWQVKFHAWSDSTDPRSKVDQFAALLRGAPMATLHASRLDYEWYRPADPKLPQAKWALEATSAVALAPGTYTLRAISDDAVRVWVDGTLVIDDWTPHESKVDAVPLAAGRHELRVQYYQVDGWTELRLDIVKGAQRAGGSPGPH